MAKQKPAEEIQRSERLDTSGIKRSMLIILVLFVVLMLSGMLTLAADSFQ